jgi:hypothetical protein
LTRYRFRASAGTAWGASGAYEVYVDGNDVVEVREGEPAGVYADQNLHGPLFGSVEDLFAGIESVPDVNLTVEYDPEWGYPTRIRFDDPGCVDEEWGLSVESLEPFDGPMPTAEPPPQPDPDDLELAHAFGNANALVVARVAGPVGTGRGVACKQGWVVAVEVEQAIVFGPTPPYPIETGAALPVLDQGGSRPRVLRGLEGQRVLMLLYYNHDPGPGYYTGGVAAIISDGNLDFVGASGDLYEREFLLLCAKGPADAVAPALDSEAGLSFMLGWAEAMAGREPDPNVPWADNMKAALRQACQRLMASPGA